MQSVALGTLRARHFILLAGAFALLAAPSCRSGAATSDSTGSSTASGGDATSLEPPPRPDGWPEVLVTGPGSGPALYLGHEDTASVVGYLNPGLRIRIDSAPVNGRIKVTIAGGLPARGWVPINRIAAYAQERGRVEGTRAYLGPNDLVGVIGVDGDNLRVEARPWLGGGNFLNPLVGTFPAAQLGAREVDGAEDVSAGECFQLPAGEALPVFERPGGDVAAEIPALDPPATVVVLRQRDGWFGVRAGYGPYVTGYMQGALTPCAGARPAPAPMIPGAGGERPYWMGQENGPLHRVASGTRVQFRGETIARLRTDGWARELGRQAGDRVDVFVAVDDNIAIRGLVDADSLTLVEGASTVAGAEAPAAPAAPPLDQDEDLPDELQ